MGTPAQYLPPVLSDETIQSLLSSLDLPAAETISQMNVTAAYHSIYLLTFPASAAPRLTPACEATEDQGSSSATTTTTELVLRVSGRHLPGIKTANEVAAMRWVRAHAPGVPVPAVVRADATEDNPLGHEFTLLERARGVSLHEAWDRLGAEARRGVVAQLAGFVGEMQAHEWGALGGLRERRGAAGAVEVVPGQVVDETFWQAPDVERFWGPGESVGSLNVAGPYGSYAALCAAGVGRSAHGIERHASLAWARDLLPRLRALADLLAPAEGGAAGDRLGLNDGRLVLAHRDLHMANVLVDPSTGEVTAVLDWEFAGVVPASRWNPVRAFLWNTKEGDASRAEKAELMAVFAEICAERNISVLEDARANEYQVAMQTIVNHLRAMVEVCARGERAAAAREWRKVVEENLVKFGV